jgi:tRNA (guanine37-N1)-methyltransferase
MKITVLTLFPEVFNNFLNYSIVKKIIDKKNINVKLVNFRDYSNDKRKRVDDYQIGGGGGMLLKLQPLVDCINSVDKKHNATRILLTPQGETFNQSFAKKLSLKKDIILICGHYEGFDERLNKYIDISISIGDYVLTGGEIPAMVLIESISRLLDGSISKQSLDSETFDDNLLDYPQYTKPLISDNQKVPEILLSGDHKKINK